MVSSPSPSPTSTSAVSETKQHAAGAATTTASEKVDQKYAHSATPLHNSHSAKKTPRRGRSEGGAADTAAAYVAAVSCSDCRFKQRAVAPASPGAVIRSLFVSLTSAASEGDGEQWRLAVADLSRRLDAATRTRDDAVEETARLKHSLAELELKLARLEARVLPPPAAAAVFPVESFLRAVSTARATVRNLTRALSTHLRSPASPGPSLESFLNRAFHADFELDTEGDVHTADPAGRCEANLAAYHAVAALTWEEVLVHGTKHFSEGLSRFCNAKMSEVVSSLGWARAPVAGAVAAGFLPGRQGRVGGAPPGAVRPPAAARRAVDRGARFDSRFMEDAAAARAGRLEPVSVKMMVAPGFHVYIVGASIVKCKVVCFYNNGRTGNHRDGGTSVNGELHRRRQSRRGRGSSRQRGKVRRSTPASSTGDGTGFFFGHVHVTG